MKRDCCGQEGMNCFQIALDVLESIHSHFPEWKSPLLWDLKVLLRLLRTFYLCGSTWGKGVEKCASTLLRIEDIAHKHAKEIRSICLKLRDGDGDDQQLTDSEQNLLWKGIARFLVCVHRTFWQELVQLYQVFLDGSCRTRSSTLEAELVEIIDSLLENLEDTCLHHNIHVCSQNDIVEVDGVLNFLKNLILFAMFRGLEPRQMDDLLIHVEGLVADAARLTFMSWHHYSATTDNLFKLKVTIYPSKALVGGIYVGVLQASKVSMALSLSSHHPTPGRYRLVLGNFVDSLIFLLWELLSSNSTYMEIFNHQIQKLYDDVNFLRTILREGQNKVDAFYEKMHDSIVILICEAGIIISYLFVKANEGDMIKMLEKLLLDLEEKFKLIKAEEETQEYALMSVSSFPQTNIPGFIEFVLAKMDIANIHEADSKGFANDKLKSIHDDLTILRSFLDEVMDQDDPSGKLQDLLHRIAAVVYQTEFVLDSFWIGDNLENLAVLLNALTEEISIVKAEVMETFHSKRQIAKIHNTAKPYSKVPSGRELLLLNELVVGLHEDAQKIVDQLTRGTKQLDIVSIVGMAGLGKTTLARKVRSDPSIILHFHDCAWCSVSQVYSKRSLLLAILSDLDDDDVIKNSTLSEDDLAEMLYKRLKGKRYLIILDDVWDKLAWDCLRCSFPDDVNGSRILLTSRHYKLALQIKPDREPHHLRFLTSDESWELLQKKICFEEDCPQAVLELGMEVSQHCKGLPLTIVIFAGILSNMKQETWGEVVKSLRKGTLSVTEQYIQTLELSYFQLPNHLKACFLYFGAFQEDQQIPLRELLWLWIAEGFVEKKGKESIEQVAEGYMMELVQRSLVMVARKRSRGNVKSCTIHDILHDFCKKKCNEENFLHCLHGYELGTSIEPTIIYRLRLDTMRIEDFGSARLLCPRLRTFFFLADYHETRHEQNWYNILNQFFRSKLLRVLDMRRIFVGRFFPTVIESLVHLRYLALTLEDTMSAIPSSIDKLRNLETFIVQRSLLPIPLPFTVWNMKKLRHLYTTGSGCWQLPQNNPETSECDFSLEDLETLSTVMIFCDKALSEVTRKFPNLRKLRCVFVAGFGCTVDCKTPKLELMSLLESLTFYHSQGHVLQLQLPHSLKKLDLSHSELPWSEISAIHGLPNLEVLKLQANAFTGKVWDMEDWTFPTLRFLKLKRMDLARWMASDDNLPLLEILVMEECSDLEELPSCLTSISTLQMIEVFECESAISAIQQIQEELMDVGYEDLKILIHPSREWS